MSMMLSPRALAATAFAALGLAALAVAGGWTPLRATAAPAPSAGITISSNVPADLVTAAPVASLNDAATQFSAKNSFHANVAASFSDATGAAVTRSAGTLDEIVIPALGAGAAVARSGVQPPATARAASPRAANAVAARARGESIMDIGAPHHHLET